MLVDTSDVSQTNEGAHVGSAPNESANQVGETKICPWNTLKGLSFIEVTFIRNNYPEIQHTSFFILLFEFGNLKS